MPLLKKLQTSSLPDFRRLNILTVFIMFYLTPRSNPVNFGTYLLTLPLPSPFINVRTSLNDTKLASP